MHLIKTFFFLILEQLHQKIIFPFLIFGSVLNIPGYSIPKLLSFYFNQYDKMNSHGPIIQKECCRFDVLTSFVIGSS